MQTPGLQNQNPSPVRQPVLLGLFTGTSIGAGYLLAGVPNVELMTLVTALAGVALGPGRGFLSGVIAMCAYSLGSPLGLPVPLLLVGQALGLGLAGFWAGRLASRGHALRREGRRLAATGWAVLIGLVCTLSYDILTNLAIIGAFDLEPLVVLAGAVPFALIHLGVNGLIFALVFPVLSGRLRHLALPPLQGRGAALVLLVVILLYPTESTYGQDQPAAASADTTSLSRAGEAEVENPLTARAVTGPRAAFGWRRPLWQPYAPTTIQWLDWWSQLVPMRNGGLGSPVQLLGDGGTGSHVEFFRDGVPLGTGHALLDDPWLISNQGASPVQVSRVSALPTGSPFSIHLETRDPSPDRAVSLYRGIKGPHETYHRGFSILTPRASWRAGFEFDESLDNEGFNTSFDPDEVFFSSETFRGHAKIRTSRTWLERRLDDRSSLTLQYTTGRKTKDDLPAWGADHQELWQTGFSAVMRSGWKNWRWRAILHSDQRDSRWGERPTASSASQDSRFLEATRHGLTLDIARSASEADTTRALRPAGASPWSWRNPSGGNALGTPWATFSVSRWAVADSGAVWLPATEFIPQGSGHEMRFAAGKGLVLGNLVLNAGAAIESAEYGGLGVDGGLTLIPAGRKDPAWQVSLAKVNRAPRSDELLTPLRRDIAGQELLILANAELERESAWEMSAAGSLRFLGFDLALDASLRKLTDGITWLAVSEGDPDGRWQNGLEMNSSRLTGSLGRQGRFLGWARLKLEGTWQNFDETRGRAAQLPPEQHIRMHLMWENHFFREDGILQLALLSTRRGELADPWDPRRQTMLPAATWHDLILGFRLVGVHLSLALRNLTGQEYLTSASTKAPGQEMDMRLHWVFHY